MLSALCLAWPAPAPIAGPLLLPQEELAPADAEWSFLVEPYYWHAGIEGTGKTGGDPPSDIGQNLSFFGGLDGGFLLHTEARPPVGRFGVLSDLVMVSLADDEGPLRTATDALVLELGGAFSLDEGRSWELIAGARYVDLEYRAELVGLGGSVGADWIDPWIGARKVAHLPRGWELLLRADVGGFDVGSQFSWQAAGAFRAPLGHGIRLDLGWRTLSVDFDSPELVYNARVSGLLVGLAFEF